MQTATISPAPLPPDALLCAYVESGAFTDCYLTRIDGHVTHAEFVEAFYTTRLFKLERMLLAALARAPSSDDDAKALARGHAEAFAVWIVERRAADQLLLAERSGRTRSWLMVAHQQGVAPQTLLYFGSALVLRRDPSTGQRQMSRVARTLLSFHDLYSRALLRAAQARLMVHRERRTRA